MKGEPRDSASVRRLHQVGVQGRHRRPLLIEPGGLRRRCHLRDLPRAVEQLLLCGLGDDHEALVEDALRLTGGVVVQPDMKKLVAYSSVSHLGFVVLGISAMNPNGLQGAVYQMVAHGVSTGGLFLIVGMLSDRRHTRLIAEYGGIKAVVPRLSAAFLVITLSSIGLPSLNGFI